MAVLSRLSNVPACEHSLCHQQPKPKRTDSKGHPANYNESLIEKQIP